MRFPFVDQAMRGATAPPVAPGSGLLRLFALATISVLGLLLLLNHQRLFTRPDLTWLAMQERGTWRVGMDPSFPPFETLDEQGRPVGFDVALAERMAAAWGLELEIVPIGYDSLLDALQTGQIDSVVSALPYDPRITQDVAFSPPYFEAGVRLAVRAGSSLADLSITESDEFVAQLAGLRIAVEWGSVSDGVGRRLQRAEPSIELAPHPTPHDAAQALLDDPSIDALLIDNVSLRQKQGEGAALVAVGPALEGNPYVIAAPFTARTLQQEIADTLQRLQESGEMDKIEREWFGAVP